MTASTLYDIFKEYHPDIGSEIASYGYARGRKDTIKMRDKKGHLYIFQFEGSEKWALYYGAAAVNFERSIKNG